jgi:prepilin-type N-terminal cleavage/methylation domain-containing protein
LDKGFTLIETLILVAVIGVLAAIATPFGSEFIDRHRLSGASRQLYATLQEIRLGAMTKAVGDRQRGYGIRFTSSTEYLVFLFEDASENFTHELIGEVDIRIHQLPRGISLTLGNATDPTGSVLLFDKKGFSRQRNWSSLGGRTYVLRNTRGAARCVTVSDIRIREGVWDGSKCRIQ